MRLQDQAPNAAERAVDAVFRFMLDHPWLTACIYVGVMYVIGSLKL